MKKLKAFLKKELHELVLTILCFIGVLFLCSPFVTMTNQIESLDLELKEVENEISVLQERINTNTENIEEMKKDIESLNILQEKYNTIHEDKQSYLNERSFYGWAVALTIVVLAIILFDLKQRNCVSNLDCEAKDFTMNE